MGERRRRCLYAGSGSSWTAPMEHHQLWKKMEHCGMIDGEASSKTARHALFELDGEIGRNSPHANPTRTLLALKGPSVGGVVM
jgi:hypothetical protein